MPFKNEPTKKFFEFFDQKIKKGELDMRIISSKFEKFQAIPGAFMRSLKTGKSGVTIELILLAQRHFGLDPSSLFNASSLESQTEAAVELNEELASPETVQVPVSFLGETLIKQQAILEVLLADKAEEVARLTRQPVKKVVSEFEMAVTERLQAIRLELDSRKR